MSRNRARGGTKAKMTDGRSDIYVEICDFFFFFC